MARFQRPPASGPAPRGRAPRLDLLVLPAFAALAFGQLAALGLNASFPSAVGALAEILAALAIVACFGRAAPAGFWTRAALPGLLVLAAVAWAAWDLAPGARTDWAEPFRQAAAAPARALTPDDLLLEIAKLLGLAALGLAAALVASDPRRLSLMVDLLLVGAGIYVIFTLILYRHDDTAVFGLSKGGARWRFTGSFLNPNAAGCVFAMLSALAAGALRAQTNRLSDLPRPLWGPRLPRVLLTGLLLFVLAGATALTKSRTALACEVAAVGLVMVWGLGLGRKGGLLRLAPAVLIAAAVGAGLVITGVGALDRNADFQASAQGRVVAYDTLSAKAAQAPVHGYGPGSFPKVVLYGLDERQADAIWNFRSAHNALVQAALDGGAPYLGLLMAAVVVWLWPALSRPARPEQGSIRRGLLAAAAVALACSLVDIALNVPAVAALAVLLLGLYAGSSQGAPAPRRP